MPLPGTHDIIAYRGDTLQLTFNFKDADGEPLALSTTGWRAQIRNSYAAVTPQASATVDATGAATGVIIVTFSASETADLTTGVWDLEHAAAGVVRTYLRGTTKFEKDATR